MTTLRPLPPGPLIAYYGDDFTGSSAVMEATQFAGLDTVLFLSVPTAERLAAFSAYRVIGFAGIARSQSPEWMLGNLPDIFRSVRANVLKCMIGDPPAGTVRPGNALPE